MVLFIYTEYLCNAIESTVDTRVHIALNAIKLSTLIIQRCTVCLESSQIIIYRGKSEGIKQYILYSIYRTVVLNR